MNDGLRAAIEKEVVDELGTEDVLALTQLSELLTDAVRAWLALPPSEAEIDAAADAVHEIDHFLWTRKPCHICTPKAQAALVASRAVLVRPPEEKS